MALYMCTGGKGPLLPGLPHAILLVVWPCEGTDSTPWDLKFQIKALVIFYWTIFSPHSLAGSPQATLNAHATPLYLGAPAPTKPSLTFPTLLLWCHSSFYPGLVGSDLPIFTAHFPVLFQSFGKGLLILFYSLLTPLRWWLTRGSTFMISLMD